MCGICGEWNPEGIDRHSLERMNRMLGHRGPDDQGIEHLGSIGLAVRRLSIIDLERGHQPIANEDGTVWIAFNGEIYNYRELRRELTEAGHRFSTSSDTEVALHLYEDVGERVVDRLHGMFAFAIWDARRRKLVLARDRFGQKPLFYTWDGARFLFSSEIKGLLAALPRTPEANLEALDDYLTLRFVPSPNTMFDGVCKVPPAHLLVLDTSLRGADSGESGASRLEFRRYWSLEYVPKLALQEEDAVREVRRLLRQAVESHLISDVPLGAFLSGGMDSSLIACMASEIADQPIPTFSIGVREQDFDELRFARRVADRCGSRLHEEVVWPDLVSLLPKMIFHLEEPSDPVAACMYHAAELAAQHVKVVLTGDGGDEVFAGFDRYSGYRWVRYYAALPAGIRRRVLGPLIHTLPDSAGYKTLGQKGRWLHALARHTGGRRYAEATTFFRFGAADKHALYGPHLIGRLADRDPADSIVAAFESASAAEDLDRMLSADIETRLPEHSLMLTDRMTMLHSLEGRSPFLDHRLAEFVAALPTELKVRRGRLKYLLRRAAEPYLPEDILRRPKQGFMFPIGYWMKGPLVPVLKHLAQRSALVELGVLRSEGITRLLEEHLADRADHHARLWMLLNLEVWYEMFVRGRSTSDLESELEERVASGRVR